MVQINFALREVNVKIVYYGPGRSGKTTNLEVIHSKAPKDSIGEMMSIATETDRTLFFDFLPLDLGKVAGMNTKFQLYTVPGQVYYKATRKLVLQGADGVVFVADSQADMMEENLQSISDLTDNLAENGLDIANIPLVFQWNKRDLENILPPEELNSKINQWNAPHFGAIAIKGDGVFATLKALAGTVIQKLNREHGYGDGDGGPPNKQAQAAPPPAPPVGDAASLAAELSQGAAPATPATPPAPAQAAPPPPPAPKPASAPAAPPPVQKPPPAPAAPPPPARAAPPPPAKTPPPPPAKAVPPSAAKAAPPPPTATPEPPTVSAKKKAVISGTAPSDTNPPPVAPPPPSAKPPAPAKPERIPTEDLNPVSRELRKHREDRERKQKEQIERIKRSSRKPLKKDGISPVLIIIGLVITAAIGAILFFVFNGS